MSSFFRQHARRLEKTSLALMLIGFLMLCQPISQDLFSYSVLVMLAGLVGFNVFARVQSPAAAASERD
jgi:hypothetical protein